MGRSPVERHLQGLPEDSSRPGAQAPGLTDLAQLSAQSFAGSAGFLPALLPTAATAYGQVANASTSVMAGEALPRGFVY